ncbi:amidohydrolase [Spongiibacter sp.]|uniref:amidohydrolase n=1 Tax=Spongiibacter sp. TaxID=2024860 RepID=UPI000C3FC8F4|nr:amidohydrolase [Spongiibacter sp.]MBU73835.1 amidohydrolase [Spongiibacter sp.]
MRLIILTCLMFSGLLLAGCEKHISADMIFYNGKVVTVDGDFTIAEAIAVKDGKVLATGSTEQVMKAKSEVTKLVDLDGKTLLPGLIDSHQHTLSAAVSEFRYPIPVMKTVADVLAFVKERAAQTPEGGWVWVRTTYPTRLRDHRLPTGDELTAAAPEHKVVFAPFTISPFAVLSKSALAAAGIDKAFAAEHPDDIIVDEEGEPTGKIRHHTRYIEDIGTPDHTQTLDERTAMYRKMSGIYNSVGLTTVADRNTFPDVLAFYQSVADRGLATTRIGLFHALSTGKDVKDDDIKAEIHRIAALPVVNSHDPMVQVVGIKTFFDGGILSGSALFNEPWGKSHVHGITDPHYHGKSFISPERLRMMMAETISAGMQFTSHAVGDGAVLEVVKAYNDVNKTVPVKGSRSSVTHGNFTTPWAIDKMAELGIVADIQPAWFYLDSFALLKQFGDERLRYFQPLKTYFDKGIVVAGGSDHWSLEDPNNAVNPFNPFLAMWISHSRKARWVEKPVHPEQAITRQQALRMYTINAAFALNWDDIVGSLEAGKYADMVIIDRDILSCDIDDIKDTKVLETYLAGKRVYAR